MCVESKSGKFLILCVASVIVLMDTPVYGDINHVWREFYSAGVHGGGHLTDKLETYLLGVNAFYNSTIEHKHDETLIHSNSIGVIGMANHSFKPVEEISLTALFTGGTYLDRYTLIQWGGGIAYADSSGMGISSILHLAYTNIRSKYVFSAFIQGSFFGIEDNRFILGVSVGLGALTTIK